MKVKKVLTLFELLCVTLLLPIFAEAAVITGYDVQNAALSGFGGSWAHSYTGTITPTGGSGSVGSYPYTLADYTGGTGTLADGTIGTDISTSQLFATYENPTITLYLDGSYLVGDLALLNFTSGNSIPGNITGLDVTIGGITETLATTVLNTRDEYVDVASSATLPTLTTSSIILSNFTTAGSFDGYFSISEITVGAVPEPASIGLLGLMSGGIFFIRRRFCLL